MSSTWKVPMRQELIVMRSNVIVECVPSVIILITKLFKDWFSVHLWSIFLIIKILTLLTDCNSDMNKHNILLSCTVSSTYITWEAVRRNWMVICRDFMVFHVLPNVSQVLCNMKNYLRIPFTTIGLSLRWLMSLYVIINKTL